MKRIEWLHYLMMTVMMMFMATACSENNEDDNPKDPTKPETPVSDGDWQTIPVGGGTIEKGDITIEFPSGTFKKDTKIAVTKVKKGEICGDNEVSEFYQITAPVTTYQPMTIKIKSDKQRDGISLVLHSLTYAPSFDDTSYSDIVMETTYKNGEYVTTMPVLENKNDNETIYYTFGLAISPLEKSGTRAVKGGFEIKSGMVGDVIWKLYIAPSAEKIEGYDMVLNEKTHTAVSQYIEESIQKILDLGFKLRTWGNQYRVVPFYYTNTPDYGQFRQSPADSKFNCIEIGVDKLKKEGSDPSKLKCTIIHELFHYFQAEYDPRVAFNKAGSYFNKEVDNQSIINEMASVWVEQFMNDGNLNVAFLDSIFQDSFFGDMNGQVGFGQEVKRWNKKKEDKKINEHLTNFDYLNYQEQGYSMGPWLQYMLQEIKTMMPNNKDYHPVLKLYDIFKAKWKNKTYNAYYIIEEWLNSYDKFLLSTSTNDDYYLKLWQGQVVKGFNIQKLLKDDRHFIFRNNFPPKKEADGRCFPYGCAVNKFSIVDYKDIKLDDKELVIKQENPNVKTYLLLINLKNNKFNYIVRNYGTEKEILAVGQNDSITLRGKTLDKLRLEDGSFNHEFFLITVNKDNKLHDETVNLSHVTIELRDTLVAKEVKQDDKNISSITLKMILNVGNGGTDGVRIYEDVTFLKNHLTVSKSGNGFKVAGKINNGSNDTYTLSFNVSGKNNGKYAAAKDVVFERQYLNEKYSVQATDVPCTYMSSWGTGAGWHAYDSDGTLKINKVSYSKKDNNGKGPSYDSYMKNNENELDIFVQFEE